MDRWAVGLHYGQRNASSDNLAIIIHGRSCHGAYPAGGVDAIVVAAQVVTALQTVVSRNVDARDSAVVTFGTIEGGTQGNILASRVRMVGTVRTLDPAIRETGRCGACARSPKVSPADSARGPRSRSSRATTR